MSVLTSRSQRSPPSPLTCENVDYPHPAADQIRSPPCRVEVWRAVHAFGDRQVLRGVDLELSGGEIYGLLGANGAGKSTLIKAIASRLRLISGRITVDGRDLRSHRKARRAVSYVPQEIAIFQHLTVSENLHVFGRFAGLAGRQLNAAVGSVLTRARLADRADQLCRTLSGGYQRRVNICASILHDPAVLLLDEPTVGIDVDARDAIHGLLDGLRQRGTALLIATHDLDQAQALCNRIGLMQEGQICLEGAPDELVRDAFGADMEVVATLRASPSEAGCAVLRDMGFLGTQSPLTWFAHASAGRLDAGELSTRFANSGLPLKELRIRRPDLSSLFLSVLGRGEH